MEEGKAVRFSYQYVECKLFQRKNYQIFINNNDEKTKISYLSEASTASNPESSNQASDEASHITDKVKKLIEESIKKMVEHHNTANEIDNKTKLKFYKYLALAIKLGGVGNKESEYESKLSELNQSITQSEYKLKIKEAKKLSFLFQQQSKDENIYTGRIAEDQENINLVGMRTKRIPLDLLKEMADGLGNENSKKFKDFLNQIQLNPPATQFSARGLGTPARANSQANKSESR